MGSRQPALMVQALTPSVVLSGSCKYIIVEVMSLALLHLCEHTEELSRAPAGGNQVLFHLDKMIPL